MHNAQFCGEGISCFARYPPPTNCNDSPGNRPFFCSYFGYSGTKVRKKIEKYQAFLTFFRNFVRNRSFSLYKGSLGE